MEKTDNQKPGVVYLPTIPPYMDAAKLRHLLQHYARIGRIYLTEEDASKYANRVKSGGCKKISYTEGWVEFLDKDEAKNVALMLNAKPIGGKKRHNFYHDDIWCMKYLSKFTWNDLMEHRVHVKEAGKKKLQVALMKQKKQDEDFIESISQKKHFDKLAKKKEAKGVVDTKIRKRVEKQVFKPKRATPEAMVAKESLLSAFAM